MTAPAPLRVLIADDEPLARRGIRARLARTEAIEIVAECEDGEETVANILALQPDLVFLDVQMPELDGLAVVREVGPERMPLVVFVTAFDAHALAAFEAHAVDYLLKPIDDERFAEAVARARERIAERRAGAVVRQLTAALAALGRSGPAGAADAPAAAGVPRLVVRDGGRVLLLEPDDVDWIEAEGDYVRLHVGARNHLVRETMASLAARLPDDRFVRIHRSCIVNVARIREIRPAGRESIVVLRDGRKLGVSRGHRRELETRLRLRG